MLNFLRSIKHSLIKTASPFEIEQKVIIDKMKPLFEQNSKHSYWLNEKKFSNYLSAKRITFIQNLIYLTNQHISFKDLNSHSVCDVSFGSGYLLYFLNKQYPQLHLSGTELNADAIKVVQYLVPSISNCYHQNIYELDIPKQDVIFCTEVLEHLTHPEKALKNLVNSISENGHLIITVPNGREDISIAGSPSKDNSFWSGHINFWSPESWKIFIEKKCPEFKSVFFTIPDYGYSKNGVILSLL